MAIFFDILYLFYAILYFPFLILRGKWHGGFKERVGFFSSRLKKDFAERQNIWIHAVSVGEVVAIEGVLRRLQAVYPDKRIVLSVTTKAGYALAQTKYPHGIILLRSPLDFSFTARVFVKTIRPMIYIAAETELWPNLFRQLESDRVSIMVINGRISDESYPRYRLAKMILQGTLRRVRIFCMQSDLDAQRIIALGVLKERVRTVGNIKFDNAPHFPAPVMKDLGFSDKELIFVGGSTHPGEEDILLDIFLSLRGQCPALRLVLAPRHPERSLSIADAVREKLLIPVLFSKRKDALKKDEVLILDTIGHLLGFYSIATIVFVGKSLTVKGGHNIIEPALFCKPILIGPHMQNFRDVTRAFITDGAVRQVEDAKALHEAVAELLEKPALREDLGRKASVVVGKNCGATERTLDCVGEILR
ncbi:MAG: 3-deoxy-D-manno-octulosonic acid transferase [Candidatus Omnitrophica bacterium]|nr:3-deoxy-D-manno-octulosonic acid transferase [Candidatus Omnitrophota bacterium]